MVVTSPSPVVVLAVGALLGAVTWRVQDSSTLMRVGTDGDGRRALLRALPREEGSPLLAELLPGTAVRVGERREGFARVVVEGWLPESALSSVPGAEAQAVAPVPGTPPPPPPPPEPVADLALAHHVGVEAKLLGAGDGRELVVALELRTLKYRPVVVPGSRQPGRVRVYEQRRIAGGRARGPELLQRSIEFEAGRATLVLPLSDLGATPPRAVLISASAELGPQRTIHGAATDVPIGSR